MGKPVKTKFCVPCQVIIENHPDYDQYLCPYCHKPLDQEKMAWFDIIFYSVTLAVLACGFAYLFLH